MINVENCACLEEVREQIDRIDRQIVVLLAERGRYVKRAARFKSSAEDVKAPARVEQVIGKVRRLSEECGANPLITEQVYRAMILGFVSAELREHSALNR